MSIAPRGRAGSDNATPSRGGRVRPGRGSHQIEGRRAKLGRYHWLPSSGEGQGSSGWRTRSGAVPSWVARRLTLAWVGLRAGRRPLFAARDGLVLGLGCGTAPSPPASTVTTTRPPQHRARPRDPGLRGPSASTAPRADPPGQDRLVGQEPPQVLGHRLGRRVPRRRVLVDRLQDDRLQVARDPRVDRPRPRRLLGLDLLDQLEPVRRVEAPAAA